MSEVIFRPDQYRNADMQCTAQDLYDRLDASTKALIAERDCFYESCSLADGQVPDPDDRRQLLEMDEAIDANQMVLARARGES